MALIEAEKNARQSNDQKALMTILPQIILSNDQVEIYSSRKSIELKDRILLLKNFLRRKNQNFNAVQLTINQLLQFENITLSDLELLLTVCKGHIYLEETYLYISLLIRQLNGELKYCFDIFYGIFVETFTAIPDNIVMTYMIEQLRYAIVLNDYLRADNIFRKIRNIPQYSLYLQFEYYRTAVDYSIMIDDYSSALNFLFKISELGEFERETCEIRNLKIFSDFENSYFFNSTDKNNFSAFIALLSILAANPLLNKTIQMLTDDNMRKHLNFFTKEDIIFPFKFELGDYVRSEKLFTEYRKRILQHNLLVLKEYTEELSLDCLSNLLAEEISFIVKNITYEDIFIDQKRNVIIFQQNGEKSINRILELVERAGSLAMKKQ